MIKNTASQVIAAQLNSLTDGSPVTTGTTTVYVLGDGGTQGAGGGTVTHEGQGTWSYVPTQAETNYAHICFTFTNSAAISAAVNVYTTYPQTGDSYARLGAPAGASIAADIAVIDGNVDSVLADTNELQTDWVNGGRLDLILDARASQTTADAILADTNELQTDWVDGGRLDLIVDATLADTNELQTNQGNWLTATTVNLNANQSGVTIGTVNAIAGTITTLDALDTAQDIQHNTTQSLIVALNDPSSADIADAVWDEILTGETHNIATSAGRRLRNLIGQAITDGTAVSATSSTIVLNGDASTVDGAYDPAIISIITGTGAGQTRLILEYAGATKTAYIDRDWKTTPDNTSYYVIGPHPGREHVNEGKAQGGGANTITLNILASANDDNYVNQVVFIRAGTGADQVGLITAYNGITKVATVAEPWAVQPDSTSVYIMLPLHAHDPAEITADIDANSTQLAAILTDTGTTIPAQISALNDVSVADILTSQMTEAYAADGTAPTLAQALFLIQQMLGDFSISGTTLTVKKLDGSTTAATFTLDDGTTPTSLTRAS